MLNFLIKRLIGLIFVLLAVTFITFIMGYLAPGDPIQLLLGNHYNQQVYLQLKHLYGLDLPWYQQYWNYLVNLVHLNFGLSFEMEGQSVWSIFSQGIPASLELGVWALVLQFVLGIPLGVLSALRANTWVDTTNMTIVLILFAVPTFILGIFAQVVIVWLDLHVGLNWPPTGWGDPWQYSWPDIQAKLAPIIVDALGGFGYIARFVRTSILEVLNQDYIRTARAKGLRERAVIYRHALRNALIPMVTILGVSIGILVTGDFFVENIFNIPGIASLTIDSVSYRDYPVIQAAGIILAVTVVLGNLISDILYTMVDPRIKAE